MVKQLIIGLRTVFFLTILTGLIYPGAVTGLAQTIFPKQANGSLIKRNGKVVGSELIGQSFDAPGYFHGRPSAAGNGYDASNSGGSNLGPTSQKLADRVKADIAKVRKEDGYDGPIPSDMVTTSGSGLDPDISPASAEIQAARVAKARNLPVEKVKDLIAESETGRQWGFFGEPRVNVLKLNLALDQAAPK